MDKDFEELLALIEAISHGDYSGRIMSFCKPGKSEKLRRLAEAVGLMMVGIEAREYRLKGLISELEEANVRLREDAVGAVAAMGRAIAARDAYTCGHSDRVAHLCAMLGSAIGLEGEELENLRMAGQLHDIGKIGFDDDILHNESPVPDPDMLERIRRHPQDGADILESLDFLGPVREYVLHHHERPDGKGYPFGATAERIPLGAKIVAVADVFDALTSDRSYQKGKSVDEAFAIMDRLAGTGLDAGLVAAFKREIAENGQLITPPAASGQARPESGLPSPHR